MISPITRCRLCSSSSLERLFSLGAQYVSDFPKSTDEVSEKVPITLVLCKRCSLVQLEHTAPQDFMYTRHYWYRSGITDTMCRALEDITSDACSCIPLMRGDVVLDIGSNDGTLLRSYPERYTRVGVEPADNLASVGSEGIEVFIHDFWNYESYTKHVNEKAKIITAIGMFYDLEDPLTFVKDIAKALAKDGLFVAQLMCLQNMLNINDIGNLAHEHLEFYSLASLEYMFDRCGLELFDIGKNNVNGESYRLYVRHKGSRLRAKARSKHRLEVAKALEKNFDNPFFYHQLFDKIEYNKGRVTGFIKREVGKGKKVWVYGASTKGNVILQYYGLDHKLIEGAADRSPEKWGRYTVGTNIPITSEEEARKAKPDYFLVLPYAFIHEFIKREADWLAGGGKFIVPLPEMRIIS